MGSDTKRLITGMVVALALLLGWQMFLRLKYPDWWAQQHQPIPAATTQATTEASTQAVAGGGATTQATTAPVGGATSGAASGAASAASAPAGTWRARGDEAGGLPATLGSGAREDKQFAMAVEVLRKGAAINA